MSEQGTQTWRDERSGRVTASRISDVMAKPMKGRAESSTRRNYRAQLICEILSGKPVEDQFVSWDMKRAIELEPLARAEYELARDAIVHTAGFIPHPRIARAGASPDGLIDPGGMVQFKVPKTATHLDWLMAKVVPTEHKDQMFFEMACTGRQWSDFVSYERNLPAHLQLFVVRLNRDEVAIAEIENEVIRFSAEIDEIISKLPKDGAL